jgi:hypothetical protein
MVMIHMTAVVAMAENRVIGDGKGLIWHIPDDLKRVKTLTMGCPLIMGRKTWDSIGRPLPGRASIVMTRDADWAADGAIGVATMTAAIAAARDWIEATAEARPRSFCLAAAKSMPRGWIIAIASNEPSSILPLMVAEMQLFSLICQPINGTSKSKPKLMPLAMCPPIAMNAQSGVPPQSRWLRHILPFFGGYSTMIFGLAFGALRSSVCKTASAIAR